VLARAGVQMRVLSGQVPQTAKRLSKSSYRKRDARIRRPYTGMIV
jgi:hypothetical protein